MSDYRPAKMAALLDEYTPDEMFIGGKNPSDKNVLTDEEKRLIKEYLGNPELRNAAQFIQRLSYMSLDNYGLSASAVRHDMQLHKEESDYMAWQKSIEKHAGVSVYELLRKPLEIIGND